MRRALLAALAFVAGLAGGWLLAMILYIVGSEAGWWVDRDGGVAMGFAFTIGPVVGLACGLLAGTLVALRVRASRSLSDP